MKVHERKKSGHFNFRAFLPKFGFAVTLVVLSITAEGVYQIADWMLAALFLFVSMALFLEHVSSRRRWTSLVTWVRDDLDELTYVSAGLALMMAGPKLITAGYVWLALGLMSGGVVLTGWGIGRLAGRPFARLVNTSPGWALASGIAMVLVGALLSLTSWHALMVQPLSNVATPLLMVGLGSTVVYFAIRRWHRRVQIEARRS